MSPTDYISEGKWVIDLWVENPYNFFSFFYNILGSIDSRTYLYWMSNNLLAATFYKYAIITKLYMTSGTISGLFFFICDFFYLELFFLCSLIRFPLLTTSYILELSWYSEVWCMFLQLMRFVSHYQFWRKE